MAQVIEGLQALSSNPSTHKRLYEKKGGGRDREREKREKERGRQGK
jgi:hypothetical protein